MTAHYTQSYNSKFVEAGFFFPNKGKDVSAYLGVKYNWAAPIITGDYNQLQNGVVASADHVTASGNSIMITLRLQGLLTKRKHRMPFHRTPVCDPR